MAQNFMTGFADGFIRARERSEDRRHEQEQVMFKYKMDALVEQKETRRKKQEQEKTWKTQAESLAQIHGDPEAASTFMNELKNDVSYETLQKRIAEGAYSKNEAYKAPTQTVKVPNAVSQTVPVEQGDTGYVDPAVSAPNTPKSPFGFGKKAREARMQSRVDEKINQIDPTLLAQADDDDGTTSATSDAGGKYVYKPKNEIEVGDWDDAQYQYDLAEKSGNTQGMADAKLKLDALRRVENEKATIKAKAEGKEAKRFVRLGPDGKLGELFTGVYENGTVMDLSDPKTRDNGGSEAKGEYREMPEEMYKRLNSLRDKHSEKISKLDVTQGALASATDTRNRIAVLAKKYPNIATTSFSLAAVFERAKNELGASADILAQLDSTIEGKIQANDMEGIQAEIAKMNHEANKLFAEASSRGFQDEASAQFMYRSLVKSAAYQYALANADDGKLSNQDFDKNMAQIEGDGFTARNANDTVMALDSLGKDAWNRMATLQRAVDKDPAVEHFERDLGLGKGASGLKAQRMYEFVNGLDVDEETKAQINTTLGMYNKLYQEEVIRGAESANAPALGPQPEAPVERTATNPKTGERLVLRNGKWEKME